MPDQIVRQENPIKKDLGETVILLPGALDRKGPPPIGEDGSVESNAFRQTEGKEQKVTGSQPPRKKKEGTCPEAMGESDQKFIKIFFSSRRTDPGTIHIRLLF